MYNMGFYWNFIFIFLFERYGCFGKVYMKFYMFKSICIYLYLVFCIYFKGYIMMGYVFIMMFLYIIFYFYFVVLYLSGLNYWILIRLFI